MTSRSLKDILTRRWQGKLHAVIVWGLTLIIFWPVFRWLSEYTLAHEQLTHAFLVLVFAVIMILRDERRTRYWEFNRPARRDLIIAYCCAALAMLFKFSPLILVGIAFVVSAALLFVYGKEISRLAYALVFAFAAYLLIIFWLPRLDWPLRAAAGRMSAWMLSLVGSEVELLLVKTDEIKLLMTVNQHPFEVAAECNGFGLISSAVLLSILMVVYRPIGLFDRLLAVVVAIGLAFVLNSVRIFIICLLAPLMMEHYLLMHEIVGLSVYAGGIWLIWWLISGLPNVRGKTSETVLVSP